MTRQIIARICFVFLISAVTVPIANADCPDVLHIDDPPCIELCTPTAIGLPEHFVRYYFDDGSWREWDVQEWLLCDGASRYVVIPDSEHYHCQIAATSCHAMDHPIPIVTDSSRSYRTMGTHPGKN